MKPLIVELQMITANVLRRVLYIKFGHSTGTGFTIDVENRQYLVTARHVCEGIGQSDSIEIRHKGQWSSRSVKVVGLGAEERLDTDVAVLALNELISPALPLEASSAKLVWGQDVFFLGFPFGLHTSVDMNEGFPIPLIKRAIMSGSIGEPGKEREVFLLDGHNNPGFSGGPVVFRPQNNSSIPFQVMGVVSAFWTEDGKVLFRGEPTELTSTLNSGIIVCPSIAQVTEMIAANPVGPLLTRT